MSYKLKFLPKALREWERLDGSIKEQFKKVLARRLENPFVASAKLAGVENCYKIKLKKASYRLVYQVDEKEKSLTVLIVARRDEVYSIFKDRLF